MLANKQLASGLRTLGRTATRFATICYREAERIDPRPEPEPLPDYEAMADAEAVLVERARAAAKAKARSKPDRFSAANDLLRRALNPNPTAATA